VAGGGGPGLRGAGEPYLGLVAHFAGDARIRRAAVLAASFSLDPLDVLRLSAEDMTLLHACGRALAEERQRAERETEQRIKRASRRR